MPTPIVYGDILYTLSNQGVVTAYKVDTGDRLYQERLGGTVAHLLPLRLRRMESFTARVKMGMFSL
jgi:hypothetical protein